MAPAADYLEYRIKPGDNLTMIMGRLYGTGSSGAAYTAHLNQILALNPHIRNPDMIHAGTILRLMAKPAPVAPVNPAASILPPVATTHRLPLPVRPQLQSCRPGDLVLNGVPPQDELDFWMLSWIAENSNYLVVPGSIATGAFSNLLSPGNIGLIEEVGDLYGQRRAGAITRGQYDYQRASRLNQLSQNIGPMERLLFGDQTPREAIRIARGGGVPATHHITSNANRLRRLASYGKYGGYVLGGVGVAASCMQIGDTDDRQEKNEIFVETVASTAIGLGAGALVGIFLVSNPVGWGTALVLAAGTAAASYGTGKLARGAYTMRGREVDFVSGLGIDSRCR